MSSLVPLNLFLCFVQVHLFYAAYHKILFCVSVCEKLFYYDRVLSLCAFIWYIICLVLVFLNLFAYFKIPSLLFAFSSFPIFTLLFSVIWNIQLIFILLVPPFTSPFLFLLPAALFQNKLECGVLYSFIRWILIMGLPYAVHNGRQCESVVTEPCSYRFIF